MSISFVLVTFLVQLAVGMTVTAAILPPALIDKRFFKTIAFWSFLFVGLALWAKHYAIFVLPAVFGEGPGGSPALARAGQWLLYLFGLLCLFLWARIKFRDIVVSRAELFFITAVGLAVLVIDSLLFRPTIGPAWSQNLLLPLNYLSASLLLGGFLTGMIFGHWYLVNTDIPKRLLTVMAWVLIGVLIFRVAAVGGSMLLYKEVIRPGTDFLATLVSFAGHGIFFWERVLVGLAIPAVVAVMIWNTARIGSNQSATGIMYVACAFVFIGELVARYLFLLSAIPL